MKNKIQPDREAQVKVDPSTGHQDLAEIHRHEQRRKTDATGGPVAPPDDRSASNRGGRFQSPSSTSKGRE